MRCIFWCVRCSFATTSYNQWYFLQLCDVILVAGDHRIPAHKLVLGSASDYFAAAFSDDDRASGDGSFVATDAALDYCNADIIDSDDPFVVEKTNLQKLRPSEFHISAEVDPAIIADVITYIYTGILYISLDLVAVTYCTIV